MTEKEYKEKLLELKYRLHKIGDWLDIESKKKRIREFESIMQKQDAWKDRNKMDKLIEEFGEINDVVNKFNDVSEKIKSIDNNENNENKYKEIIEAEDLIYGIEKIRLFIGKYDKLSAIVTIRAGAGGEDAADWTRMLFLMYKKYCKKNGWKIKVIDVSGDYREHASGEHPIKNLTLEVNGKYVYGHLKFESGVHRLIRISPFSSKKLRHTSFALVDVLPKLEDRSLNINVDDLKIDFFRSSGPGGQNVNKVETAVRITHIPTGISAISQVERSQAQNRENAMKVLEAKLLKKKKESKVDEINKLRNKSIPEWGSQIRSYVLNPYQIIKDHRTGYETSNINSVLEDGYLDNFIESELVHFSKKTNI